MPDLKSAYHGETLKAMKGVRRILTEAQFKKMKAMQTKMTGGKKPPKGKQHKH